MVVVIYKPLQCLLEDVGFLRQHTIATYPPPPPPPQMDFLYPPLIVLYKCHDFYFCEYSWLHKTLTNIHMAMVYQNMLKLIYFANCYTNFSFQPVLHNWSNKGRGMCYPVYGMVHIKEPLLLIGKSSPSGSSGFPLSLSEQ